MVKIDVYPTLLEEELEANNKVLEPDIDVEVEVDVPTRKSIRSREASKHYAGKKITTKLSPTPQYGKSDRTVKPLGKW